METSCEKSLLDIQGRNLVDEATSPVEALARIFQTLFCRKKPKENQNDVSLSLYYQWD